MRSNEDESLESDWFTSGTFFAMLLKASTTACLSLRTSMNMDLTPKA